MTVRRVLLAVLGVSLLAPAIVIAPAAVPQTPLTEGFTVTADGAGCLDDAGNPVSCPIELEPVPLPTGLTIGEYELALASRALDGGVRTQPYEFSMAGEVGSCEPGEAACSLTTQGFVGNQPTGPDDPPELRALPALGPNAAPGGDTDVIAADFSGEGAQETVTASICPALDGQTDSEVCLSLFNPSQVGDGENPTKAFQRTGVLLDQQGTRPLRLAAGLILRTSATVTSATFADDGGGGVLATFTTTAKHNFVVGQPVRFGADTDLAARMCPALQGGSVLCGDSLSAAWLPVADVTDTTFSVRVGTAIVNTLEDGTAVAVIPEAWPDEASVGTLGAAVGPADTTIEVIESGEASVPDAPFDIRIGTESMTVTGREPIVDSSAAVYTVTRGTGAQAHDAEAQVVQECSDCRIDVTGLKPGLALAYGSPTNRLSLAAFEVDSSRDRPFRLVDVAPVGTFGDTISESSDGSAAQAARQTQPVDIDAGDYDGDGQDEVVVAWGGRSDAVSRGLVRFYSTSDAKQIVPLTDSESWDPVEGQAPYAVSLATGSFVSLQDSNIDGDDLAIAWGGRGHLLSLYDVNPQFRLRARTIDDRLKQQVAGPWTSGVEYAPGAIVSDKYGYWQTSSGGTSRCEPSPATTVDKFYFPWAPGNDTLAGRMPPVQPTVDDEWDVATPGTVPAGGTDGSGYAYGHLQAQVPTSTPTRRWTQAAPTAQVGQDILGGQFVSAPLAAQTIDTTTVRAFVQAARQPAATGTTYVGPAYRSQIVIKLVSNDGSQLRGVLLDADQTQLADAPFEYAEQTDVDPIPGDGKDEKVASGTTRFFPPALDTTWRALKKIDVQPGDRLVVELGSRVTERPAAPNAPEPDPAPRLWLGSGAGQDLPLDETQVGGLYNPFLKLSKAVKLAECGDHITDQGIKDWTRVTSPRVVRVWDVDPVEGDDQQTVNRLRAAGASAIRIDSGNLDMNGDDEVVLAHTTPADSAADRAPLSVQVWQSEAPACSAPSSPADQEACPTPDSPPTATKVSKVLESGIRDGVAAVGAAGGGQLSLAVGRLGRPGISPDDPDIVDTSAGPGYPNSTNPDIVLAWTCMAGDATCGRTLAEGSGSGVSIQPLSVCVPANGATCGDDDTWSLQASPATFVGAAATASQPSDGWATRVLDIALPDVDGNSATLGTPLEYLETGYVQPLMVLRSPPVHFDAIDANEDGFVTPEETWDVNNCFADYLATGDEYVCKTDTAYGTTTTTQSTITGQIQHAWNLAASVKVTGGAFVFGKCREKTVGPNDATAPGVSVTTEEGACVDAESFLSLELGGGEKRDTSRTIGRTFSYTSSVLTSGGNDAAYVAIQENQILEYPVYRGAGWGLGGGDLLTYATVKTPLETEFRWLSQEDLAVPLVSHGLQPQNVLSWAPTQQRLESETRGIGLAKIYVDRQGRVLAKTKDVPGIPCASTNSVLIDEVSDREPAKQDIKETPCQVGNVGVKILDTSSRYDRSYVVTQKLDEKTLVLQPAVALSADEPVVDDKGRIILRAGDFPLEEWSVRRYHKLETVLRTDQESGYENSFAWNFGVKAGAQLGIAAATGLKGLGSAGVGVEIGLSGGYEQNGLQSISLGTTNETQYTVRVSGDIKPNISYLVRPYLSRAPSGAMVFDWTARASTTQSFWRSQYFDRGPDLAFALPNLLIPYRNPYPFSRPGATAPLLLESYSFRSWECTDVLDSATSQRVADRCVPAKVADEENFVLVADVHNYSLRPYDSSSPIRVRFFVGDPAKGGYQVAEASVPSVKDSRCVNRFCLPAQGTSTVKVPWDWAETSPGLANRGRPVRPVPVYAVIDPLDRVQEVHDWTAPVDVRACQPLYRTEGGERVPNYPISGEDYSSPCPTANNEGWFTQRFGEVSTLSTPLAPGTDLSVQPFSVRSVTGGQRVSVPVRASQAAGRVEVRLFTCVGNRPCSPAAAARYESKFIGSIPAGESRTVTFPTTLARGTYTVVAQAVPIGNFENPGGGPFDQTGQLGNNVRRVVATLP